MRHPSHTHWRKIVQTDLTWEKLLKLKLPSQFCCFILLVRFHPKSMSLSPIRCIWSTWNLKFYWTKTMSSPLLPFVCNPVHLLEPTRRKSNSRHAPLINCVYVGPRASASMSDESGIKSLIKLFCIRPNWSREDVSLCTLTARSAGLRQSLA